ncbi:MarR family transcriptional regulator [Actinomadura yumaensis]|uniref:MarR family transcriptional regulator n=1 Tax=Actinomadura yumaensis TaxID=111807 RepID=A0ABW2CIF0_9ACTN
MKATDTARGADRTPAPGPADTGPGAPRGAAPAPARPPAPDLAYLLTSLERRIAARLAAALAATGCTPDEWRVLALLADGAGHPMTEIAEYALLPPPTLTKLVDRMVAANRVYRRADTADRRRILVFLSARGRREQQAVAAAVDAERDALAARAGKEELDLLAALLTRLTERLTTD